MDARFINFFARVLDYLLMFTHMLAEGVLIVCQKVALATDSLVVNFMHVCGQSFGTGCFIVTQDAEVGFDVGVEMAL